jgi:hypothetical protein
MATVRRNQHDLGNKQQAAFADAVNKLHGTAAAAPAYRAFVQVHVDAMSMAGMSWEVHTMPGMGVVGRTPCPVPVRACGSGQLECLPHLGLPMWSWDPADIGGTGASHRPQAELTDG